MNLASSQYAKYKDSNLRRLTKKFEVQFAYGHREILVNYSKLDTTCLLTGILQHGVGPAFTLYSDWPTPRIRGLKRSHLWVYSKRAVRELAAEGMRNVFAVGSPWLYSKILGGYEVKENPLKTKFLVFPKHYNFSHLGRINPVNISENIQQWKSIAGSAELEICLYWIEFLDPVWQQVAREEGVTLVCAGISQSEPMWSQTNSRVNFYVNLRQIIDSATHCIFESFTSAIFYANDLGKKVGIFQNRSSLDEANRVLVFQMENEWLLKNVPKIFNSFESNSLLDSITHELLGYDELLSPESLASVLRYQKGVIPKG